MTGPWVIRKILYHSLTQWFLPSRDSFWLATSWCHWLKRSDCLTQSKGTKSWWTCLLKMWSFIHHCQKAVSRLYFESTCSAQLSNIYFFDWGFGWDFPYWCQMITSVTVELPQLGWWFFCWSLIFQIKPPTFKVSLRTTCVLQSAVFSFTVYTLFAVCQSHLLWSFSRANPCTATQCLFLGVNFRSWLNRLLRSGLRLNFLTWYLYIVFICSKD